MSRIPFDPSIRPDLKLVGYSPTLVFKVKNQDEWDRAGKCWDRLPHPALQLLLCQTISVAVLSGNDDFLPWIENWTARILALADVARGSRSGTEITVSDLKFVTFEILCQLSKELS